MLLRLAPIFRRVESGPRWDRLRRFQGNPTWLISPACSSGSRHKEDARRFEVRCRDVRCAHSSRMLFHRLSLILGIIHVQTACFPPAAGPSVVSDIDQKPAVVAWPPSPVEGADRDLLVKAARCEGVVKPAVGGFSRLSLLDGTECRDIEGVGGNVGLRRFPPLRYGRLRPEEFQSERSRQGHVSLQPVAPQEHVEIASGENAVP